jgi:hypothetical protein
MSKVQRDSLIRYAVSSCGFLVRWGQRMSLQEFASTVRLFANDPRAEEVAQALEGATGFIARGWRGLRVNWQS